MKRFAKLAAAVSLLSVAAFAGDVERHAGGRDVQGQRHRRPH